MRRDVRIYSRAGGGGLLGSVIVRRRNVTRSFMSGFPNSSLQSLLCCFSPANLSWIIQDFGAAGGPGQGQRPPHLQQLSPRACTCHPCHPPIIPFLSSPSSAAPSAAFPDRSRSSLLSSHPPPSLLQGRSLSESLPQPTHPRGSSITIRKKE